MDRLLLRATELFQTFPQLVLNMVLAAVLGRSIFPKRCWALGAVAPMAKWISL